MRRSRPFIQPLLLALILAIGPLHAQTLYTCAMMDMVVHDTCCCDDQERRSDSDYDDALRSKLEPCCEKSVELSIDHTSDQATPVSKPTQVRSDVDPPPAMLAASHVGPYPSRVFTVAHRPARSAAHQPGTQTYLITQRLRI